MQNRVEVGQPAEGWECDGLFSSERGTDLSGQGAQLVRIANQVVESAGKGGGSGFAASDNDYVERCLDLGLRHPLVVIVTYHMWHEIGPLDVEFEAALDLVNDKLIMVTLDLHDGFGQAFYQQGIKQWVESHSSHEGAGAEVIEDERHPWVVFGVAQTVERLAKAQVADNVKGRKVQPLNYVEGCTSVLICFGACGPLAQSIDQHAGVVLQNRFLILDSALGEAMLQQPTYTSMIFCGFDADDGVGLSWLCAPPDRVFGEGEMSRPCLEYFWPCFGFGKGYLVWSNAYHGTVLEVDVANIVHKIAGPERANEGKPRSSP